MSLPDFVWGGGSGCTQATNAGKYSLYKSQFLGEKKKIVLITTYKITPSGATNIQAQDSKWSSPLDNAGCQKSNTIEISCRSYKLQNWSEGGHRETW